MAGLDSYVKLYSNFNSAIQDDFNGKSLTANGSASISTSIKKFGAGSLELSSATSDFVSCTDDTDFDLGNGDFTFDFWTRFKTLPSSGSGFTLLSSWGASGNYGYKFDLYNNAGSYELRFTYSTTGSDNTVIVADYTFAVDTWYHIAISRDSNFIPIFVDGVQLVAFHIQSTTIYNSTEDFKIGCHGATETYFLNGYIDEFRFSKGIARYDIESFVPTTTEFTKDSYTELLLHMNGADNSDLFIDDSELNTNLPKIGTTCGRFTETTSYFTLPASSDWNFGTNDYTIECWILIENLTQRISIWDMYNGSAGHFIRFNQGGNKEIYVAHGATTVVTSSNNAINDSNWHHVAVVNNSGTVTIYVDGTSVGSSSTGLSAGNSTNTVYVSSEWNGDTDDFNLNGYMDEFRVSDNARYTTSFTPSTTAFTSDANTKLLIHFDEDVGDTNLTDDGNTGHTITVGGNLIIVDDRDLMDVSGNVVIKTSDGGISPKFGTGMAKFDGDSDYLATPRNDTGLVGADDFTIELFINYLGLPTGVTYDTFIDKSDTNSGPFAFLFRYFYDNNLRVDVTENGGSTTAIQEKFTFNTAQWYHIVAMRSGSYIYLFVDGVCIKRGYIGAITLSSPSSDPIYIGDRPTQQYGDYYGYMDEVRISNGIARYTPTSFTVPTEEYSVSDPNAPVITALSPLDNATGVSKTTDLVITFDENVVTASGYTVTLYNFADDSEVEAIATTDSKISISGQTVTIDINDLAQNTHYYTLIDNGAFEDTSSNAFAGITVSTDWDFTTIAVAPPTIFTTTATILICDYQGTISAETGTVEGSITYAGHGLNQDDFLVNTTQNNTSRRILSTTTDTMTVVSVSGQTQSDIIRTYAFTDHTDKLKQQSLNVNKKIEEDTDVRFTLITDGTYVPRAGQYVKVSCNSFHVFTGFIKSVKRRLPQNGVDTKIFFDCECTTLNNIAPRRTLAIAYDIDTTASTIVESMVNDFLVSDGIGSGTIDTGIVLDDDWYDDSLSISDIIDDLAEKSGYQWFIDKNFLLQFYQEPTTVSTYSQSIDDVGTPTFNDFRDVTINETLDNYNNKAFYIGNTDDYGNIVIVSQETTASILEIQDYSAGSGVYGSVVRDSNMTNHNFYTATAGTTEGTIVATNIHTEVDVGDLVFNADRYERRNVVSVSTDTLELSSAISGQTQSDTIVVYPEINDVVDNHLKRSDVIPRVLEFNSFTTDFEPAQKLQVRLSKLSVTTTETYIIESVNIQDRGAGYYVSHVVASKRNADNLSTQKTPNYKDYFKEF